VAASQRDPREPADIFGREGNGLTWKTSRLSAAVAPATPGALATIDPEFPAVTTGPTALFSH
jgi:hypothetical protein